MLEVIDFDLYSESGRRDCERWIEDWIRWCEDQGDEASATRFRIMLEQVREIDPEAPDPVLAARIYRSLVEQAPRDLGKAKEVRALLHAATDAGDPFASEVLGLLSDDPFWVE